VIEAGQTGDRSTLFLADCGPEKSIIRRCLCNLQNNKKYRQDITTFFSSETVYKWKSYGRAGSLLGIILFSLFFSRFYDTELLAYIDEEKL